MTDKTDSKERDLLRIAECAARLVEHADFQLGGVLSADSKARDIPSRACSQVKARHLAALRDALAGRASIAPSGFDAADMATAWSNGFRDGVASLAASAGSEADMRAVVAVAVTMLFDSHPEDVRRTFTIAELSDMVRITEALGNQQVEDIYKRVWDGTFHPSPPEGMVGGWMPIETAPKDGTAIDLWRVGGGREPCAVWGLPPHCCGEMGRLCDSDWHDYQQGWVTDWFDEPEPDSEFTHWMPLPPPPTSSAYSRKGE